MPHAAGASSSQAAQVALWHPDGSRVLLRGGALPVLHVPQGQDLPQVVRAAWGVTAWTLHDGGLVLGRTGLARMQALSDESPRGLTWGEAEVSPLPGEREWQRPGWPQRAQRILDAALRHAWLSRAGELEPVHENDLVAVLRARTNAGTVYLKASATPHEAAVTGLLARTLPDLLPPLLWADPEAGYMVSASGGELLDGVTEPEAWEEAVRRLAHFQREADPTALVALGCPTYPLAETAERVDALLGDEAALRGWGVSADYVQTLGEARPAVRAAFRDLTALGLPDLPAHGDAHPRNALDGPRGGVWFDWSEAAGAAHPFMDLGWFLAFTLSYAARGKIPASVAHPALEARLAGTYLDVLGCPEAASLLPRSLPLALLHRAAVYDGHFQDWEGTVPGWRPQYVPSYLRQAVGELARLSYTGGPPML